MQAVEDWLGSSLTQRELVVRRSLDRARSRADSRIQRFLDAARELMSANGAEFTVHEVVEQSGQSLRTFYQFFDGKYELLIALLEDSVRTTVDLVAQALESEDDPLERLHVATVECYRLCEPGRDRATTAIDPAAMAEFTQGILTSQPSAAARAFAPLVTLFEDLLADAQIAGLVRPGVGVTAVAGVVLEMTMFNAFAATISGGPSDADGDGAESLWTLLRCGLGAH